MGQNAELLAGQQVKTNASNRLRAGRQRIAGFTTGSISEIMEGGIVHVIGATEKENTQNRVFPSYRLVFRSNFKISL